MPTGECNDKIIEVAKREGILLDPTYTSKAMAGTIDLIERGIIEKRSDVLFWHTGGTPALFTEERAESLCKRLPGLFKVK